MEDYEHNSRLEFSKRLLIHQYIVNKSVKISKQIIV